MTALHREKTASNVVGEDRLKARSGRASTRRRPVMIVCAAVSFCVVAASGMAVARPGPPPVHRPPPVDGPGVFDDPPIWLDLALDAQSSSWRTQYRPDDYRLPGYDGEPDGAHFCRGAHGRSLSTAGMNCPPGQTPDKGTRHLSTDPR